MTTSDARNPAKYQHIHNALYAKVNTQKATSPKFLVGDKVRITRKKCTFEKGFTSNWTEDVFTISISHQRILLRIRWENPVQGTFYEQELQFSVQEMFRIELVFKRKKDQVFVKWKGYSNAFNSWIPLTDLEEA